MSKCHTCPSITNLITLECGDVQCESCTETCPTCKEKICLYCTKDKVFICCLCFCCSYCCECPDIVTCRVCSQNIDIESSIPSEHPVTKETTFLCIECRDQHE